MICTVLSGPSRLVLSSATHLLTFRLCYPVFDRVWHSGLNAVVYRQDKDNTESQRDKAYQFDMLTNEKLKSHCPTAVKGSLTVIE